MDGTNWGWEGTVWCGKGKDNKKLPQLEFVLLEQFQKHTLFSGESVEMNLYELKRLLQQIMLELSEDDSQQLLVHQFLIGLPEPVSPQLWAVGNTTNIQQFVKHAKVLMIVDASSKEVAAVQSKSSKLPN